MIWNDHSRIPIGSHAPFAASSYAWLNYDDEKAIAYYISLMAKKKGTELHDFAARAIRLGVQLKGRDTLARYVNDAIKYRMRPEQVVFYSPNFFGTSDAIIFESGLLRIHDLKTGVTPAKLDQLLIYDALFCLEYHIDPSDIEHEIRIYQNNDIISDNPDSEMIQPIMDKIVAFDKLIDEYNEGLL